MFIVQSAAEYLFSTGSILLWAKGYSYWLYVYVVISYYFLTKTITYLTYNTLAGVAAAWYFLNDSEYMIKHPIGISFRNAIGPDFGPICLAGLMEGITEGFNYIKKVGETVSCGVAGCCFSCVQCCCKCFVCCCKCFVCCVRLDLLRHVWCSGQAGSEKVAEDGSKEDNQAGDELHNHNGHLRVLCLCRRRRARLRGPDCLLYVGVRDRRVHLHVHNGRPLRVHRGLPRLEAARGHGRHHLHRARRGAEEARDRRPGGLRLFRREPQGDAPEGDRQRRW